eukprot:ANDGO_00969.mRNA.1 DNA repair protein XRCC3 homolog
MRLLSHISGMGMETLSVLKTRGYRSAYDVLSRPEYEVAEDLGISILECRELVSKLAEKCAPLVLAAAKLPSLSNRKAGIQFLDRAFKGGIPVGILTEICAPHGCGKTQLCLTLIANTILDCISEAAFNDHVRVLYIDSDRAFDPLRFLEIFSIIAGRRSIDVDNRLKKRVLDSVVVYNIYAIHQLDTLLGDLWKSEFVQLDVSLLVVDSIAEMVRRSELTPVVQSEVLNRIAAQLKRIASTFDLPVIATNHVAADDRASLGIAWHHAINLRIRLARAGGGQPAVDGFAGQPLLITVDKSSVCPATTGHSRICDAGVE